MKIELEKESRTAKLSAEDQELLERHFQALLRSKFRVLGYPNPNTKP